MKELTLFDYQQRMLREVTGELQNNVGRMDIFRTGNRRNTEMQGRAVMVQMPTGTGKTVLMAACIRKLRTAYFEAQRQRSVAKVRQSLLDIKLKDRMLTELRREEIVRREQERWRVADEGWNGKPRSIWVIAHRRELVEQIRETLERMGIVPADGRGRTGKKAVLPVKVMSVQWLTRHFAEMTDQPAVLIVDEAHHSLAVSYKRLWKAYPQAMKLGFTATPCRMACQDFTKLYDRLLAGDDIPWFIGNGYLADYDYVVTHRHSMMQRRVYGLKEHAADGDFSIREMGQVFNDADALDELYTSLMQYAAGKKGIVYAIDIAHARNIAECYRNRGIRAVAIDNKTPDGERKRLIEDFKAGRLDCICNVNLFDEGFDCPDVEYIQLARPTLSLSKYLQMVGRGLRVHPDKEACVFIDNVGLWRIFGRPDDRRDWMAMFEGRASGSGELPCCRDGVDVACNNTMETVRDHVKSVGKYQAEEYRERSCRNTEPYEHHGKWGLKNGERVVLPPFFRKILPSTNGYFIYEKSVNQWGLLRFDGAVMIEASYQYTGVKFIDPDNPDNVKVEVTQMNGKKVIAKFKEVMSSF